VTKAQAMMQILKQHSRADFLFCAGDDRTDEELMDSIPRRWRAKSITCWVGSRNASAEYWVDSNAALLAELAKLISALRETHARPRLRGDRLRVAQREL
jgi:trehalose-6-phosphatase